MKKLSLLILIVLGIFLVGCQKETIKIGYIGPLTGDVAAVGQGHQKVLQLAIEELNSQGENVEIIFEDGNCDGKRAVTAIHKLINIDGVKYIIGGQCSSETLSTAPIAETNKVLMISPLSSNPAITNSGDYIFRVYPSDNYQGKFTANYIKNELGLNDVAVLSCLDDWCKGLKEVFTSEFETLGGTVVESQEFERGTSDLKTQLTKIKKANPEIIFMAAYTESTITAFKQSKELGINTPFFGGDSWAETTIWERTEGFNEGKRYVVPYFTEAKQFNQKYHAKYGADANIVLASLQTYDSLMILLDAIKENGDDSTKVKDYLYDLDYNGLSGKISFDNNGDLVLAKYSVMQMQNGKLTTIN